MAPLRSGRRVRQKTELRLEGLETRAMLSGFFSADQFNAYDNLNVERLVDKQSLEQLRVQNSATVQQLVADGASQTQSILADLQGGGNAAVDTANLRQVRSLMKQGQNVGSLVDRTLITMERNLNTRFLQFNRLLQRGANPASVQNLGLTVLDGIASNGQNVVSAGANRMANIDAAILNL